MAMSSEQHDKVQNVIAKDSEIANHSSYNSTAQYYDIWIFSFSIIIVLIFCLSSKVASFAEDLISKKNFRWVFSGFILPVLSVCVVAYISPANQKFVFIVGIIISLMASEKASGISTEKMQETFRQEKESVEENIRSLREQHEAELEDKQRDLDNKNNELVAMRDELSKRVNELRGNYLNRLIGIAADHQEDNCVVIKSKVKDIAQEIMASSCLLLSMDGVNYEARNNQVPIPQASSILYDETMRQIISNRNN